MTLFLMVEVEMSIQMIPMSTRKVLHCILLLKLFPRGQKLESQFLLRIQMKTLLSNSKELLMLILGENMMMMFLEEHMMMMIMFLEEHMMMMMMLMV